MRRADRLFRITQALHERRWTTARVLAESLEVSLRTVYRDIQDLSASGIPIVAEPGVGYRLAGGFRLPPLMFDAEELDALLLGARMVEAWSDGALAQGARQLIAKVEAVLPERMRPQLQRDELLVPTFANQQPVAAHLQLLRRAVRSRHKVLLAYAREDGTPSQRRVWPLAVAYWGKVWTLVAWCELRAGFRHFRLDRIRAAELDGEVFPVLAGRTLEDFLATVR